MGAKWDRGVPGAAVWRDVLRLLKAGAPLMAFGGTRTFHRLACAIEDAGFLLADTLCWLHGQGFPKGGSQLKPAWEPVTLAWKKGKRGLNIDAGRVGCEPVRRNTAGGLGYQSGNVITHGTGTHMQTEGRWPANVLLDEESARLLDEQSGELTSGANPERRGSDKFRETYSAFAGQRECNAARGADSGGASRFFYVAKADPAERAIGGKNSHPTVKPVDLCAYLAKLLLPAERDTPRRIVVPFSGSGSEIMGALRAGWDEAVGIEISAEYCDLARRRIEADAPLLNAELAERVPSEMHRKREDVLPDTQDAFGFANDPDTLGDRE